MAMIEIRGLTKRFGEVTAVADLNLEMAEGEVLALLGPNGAGKTTTIRLLAGIISPTSGYAVVAGQRTDKNIERLHESTGLLTESPGFYDQLSARRNLEFYAGFYDNLDVSAQVEKYLQIMGLWERREARVGTFSKGMKQRLALARALLHEPKVLFLDEPTAGLDPEAAGEVRNIVKKLSLQGRSILLSTHNLAEAENLCQRVAIIRTKLLALDTAQNLRHRLFRRQIVVQLESIPETMLGAVQSLPFVRWVEAGDNRLLIELENTERNRPELVQRIVEAGGRVMGVSEKQHSLEEVYLSLVRESGSHG